MKKSEGSSFIHGAIVLSVGMIFIKMTGALFKLPLANVITENGMGYFNTAYNFYAVFFSLATAGFPVAIAVMVAEFKCKGRYGDIRKVKRIAIPVFVVLGLGFSLAMFFGANAYTIFIGNPLSYYAIVMLSPTIFFCCINAIYRGYFEGLRNMYPTVISEIIESICKLVIGLSLAVLSMQRFSLEFETFGTVIGISLGENEAMLMIYALSAAAAIIGVSVGSFISFIYLFLKTNLNGDKITKEQLKRSPSPYPSKVIVKRLVLVAIPVATGSIALSIAGLVDQTILQRRISDIISTSPDVLINMYSGLIPDENLSNIETIPNFLFGCFAYAVALFVLVPSFTQAFAVSALPNLTTAWTKRNKKLIKRSIETVIKTTCICAFPAGLGLSVFSSEILSLLYGDLSSLPISSEVLRVLGIAAMFSACSLPFGAILQGMGRADLSVKTLLVGLLIKISLNYILCGIDIINIHGAGISTLASYMFICITQYILIVKVSKQKISLTSSVCKPLFCAVISVYFAWLASLIIVRYVEHLGIVTIISIVFCMSVYICVLLLTNTVTLNDVVNKKKLKST